MRQCPKCNYVDPQIWRHAWHKRFTDVSRFEDLEAQAPELAEKVKECYPSIYDDGMYIYKLSKAGYVVRIWRNEAKHLGTVEEPFRERFKAKMNISKNQRKLLEALVET